MKKFLIIYIAFNVVFLLFMGLFATIDSKVIFSGIVFGAFFTFTLVSLDYKAIKNLKEKYPGKEVRIVYSEKIELNLTYDNAFKKSLEALNYLGVKSIESDFDKGIITAQTRYAKEGGGVQKISLELLKDSNSITSISIVSKPLLFTMYIVDFGSNFKNVQRLMEFLKG